MTTAKARQAKKKYPSHKIIIGNGRKEYSSPIFWHNPYIDHLAFVKPTDKILWIRDYPGHRPYLDYQKSTATKQVFKTFKASPGDLFFTNQEIEKGKKALGDIRSFIVIEPNVDQQLFHKNKDWGFSKWQKVADHFQHKVPIVQVGDKKAESLKGIERLLTKDFRSACVILSLARAFAGTEGALHHAAAAVRIPAIVLFGGRTSPRVTGYKNHVNLYVKLKGSPCGRLSDCAHCKKCMSKITVEAVIEAIEKKLKLSRAISKR